MLFLLILFGFVWTVLSQFRQKFSELSYIPYTTPSAISKIVSLEFKGIVADFFFLKMITSFGDKIGKHENLGKRHADYIYHSTDIITDLDPYFWDAYVLGDMTLSWGFGDIDRANALLFKAGKNRPGDFRIPYYIGFNYFYFLKDNVNGAKYLMEAARLPNCPSFVPALAARLSAKAHELRTAIIFLEEMLKKTQNHQVAIQLSTRLKALVIIDYLETKIEEFHTRFGDHPRSLLELVERKIITHLPEDPYGGQFYIAPDGKRVFTTSRLRHVGDVPMPDK